MKPSDKDSSKGLGMFFSIALHVGVVVLILYWGFSGTSQYSSTPGPIQVSLSGLETGGAAGAKQSPPKKQPEKPKPPEPEKVQKKEEVKKEEPKKQEVEPPPQKKEPEKKEVVKEEKPKEKEKPKEEVVKKEPEKKEVIPLETEKEEKKVEKPKKEEKKEVAQKPKPTPKPKPKPTKKPAKKKDFDKERDRILKDIQRQKVLDRLKKDKLDTEEPLEQLDEEIGEEQRLAMADDIKRGGEPETEAGNAARRSSGGSSISPLIIQTYSNQVHRKISRNWRIPPGVPTDGGLSTSVVFKVDGNGNVNNVRITESSGNSVFDNYCTQAINRSAPLPPPPAELAEEAKNKGIELTFRNES